MLDDNDENLHVSSQCHFDPRTNVLCYNVVVVGPTIVGKTPCNAKCKCGTIARKKKEAMSRNDTPKKELTNKI
jgi:hypothetical protein